uniref:Protein Iojap, chloroplastic n=1 Tax=Rhizophora mucronata TaxID=61149 RepID=A0A2P2K1Q1_RHIMU
MTVVPTAVSVAGTLFSSDLQQLGRADSWLSTKPRKRFAWLCLSGQQSPHPKCFSRVPRRTKSLNFNPIFALRKDADDSFLSNVEHTDEMFEKLFNKYGKVVYRRNDQKPPSAEVDDDAESLSFAVAMAKVASEVKAADIKVLFVKPLVYWTQFFIIATAFSRPQIDAIGYSLVLLV